MKNLIVKPGSPLRILFPLVKKMRRWAQKFQARTGERLVVSGGKVLFMDAELMFPENVALTYATPLFWNGPEAYEAPTSRAIALLAGQSALFLDIGSNIGIYSVYVGVKFPKVKVFAFEPVPTIFEKNRAFHHANQLSDSVTQNLALSDRDGTQKLFLPVYASGLEEEQTATLDNASWQTQEAQVTAFEVTCRTLDTFSANTALPAGRVTLKIDVENFEAAVLRGGKKFLAERRPWIVCEILPTQKIDPVTKIRTNNNEEVLAVIGELKYAVFAITAEGFFRMSATDFSRPRSQKDFLLIPQEKVPGDFNFLAAENVSTLFTA